MGMWVHTHTLEQLLCHGPKSQNPLLCFNLRQAARESAERQKQLRTVTSKAAKLPAVPTHNMPSWILAFVIFWMLICIVFRFNNDIFSAARQALKKKLGEGT